MNNRDRNESRGRESRQRESRERERERERRGRGMRADEDAWRAQAEDEERARGDTEWRDYVNPNFRENWRTHFRGGYGNPGMSGDAAWGRSGLGAGYDEPSHGWARASRRGFGMPSPESRYSEESEPLFRGRAGYRGGRRYPQSWQGEQQRTLDEEEYFGLEETFGEQDRNRIVGTDWPNLGTTDWGRERGISHAGHGPEGYRRSDERIFEDVCDRLTEHSAIDARGIRVQAENGEVTLEGTVANRQAKRLAETIAEGARGVRDVHNRLRVAERAGDVP